MRDLRELFRYRQLNIDVQMGFGEAVALAGGFMIPSATERQATSTRPEMIRCIASAGLGYDWDHVSASTRKRCPTWAEMEQVKRLFFEDHETAMQLHVPPADHINNHPYCLHLWRPHLVEIPRPPGIMVGVLGATPEDIQRIRQDLQV